MDTIKSKRKTFTLQEGDIVMDNGACYQLITQRILSGFGHPSPRISKKEFAKFKTLPSVKIQPNHEYGDSVTLYQYSRA